jgi:hypothetical protein
MGSFIYNAIPVYDPEPPVFCALGSAHFPMQKRENILSSNSSPAACPER